jgi:DNA-binding CsgD family transcriptional regulator
MAEEDINEKLGRLTNRQREVLKLFCEGLKYKDIAERLFIGENTVKTHIANIYVKLGIDHLPSTLRHKILFETYCPALHEIEFPIRKDEPVEPEPAPEEVIRMVEEDEKAIIPYKPKVITIPPYEPKKKERGIDLRWIAFLIILALLIFGGYKVYEWVSGMLEGIQATSAPTEPGQVQVQTIPTEIVSQKAPVTAPTNTAVMPTPTSLPLPTNTSAPRISLPFMDNFNSGYASVWKILYGNWITGNGKLTVYESGSNWQKIILDDPTWQNYRVDVDYSIYAYGAANQEEFAVIVRALESDAETIGFWIDTLSRGGWVRLDMLGKKKDYIIGQGKVDTIPEKGKITIEVRGNEFAAKVNGVEYQRFTISGYDRGGVILLIQCGVELGCPSFDNILVEQMN